MLSTNGDMLFSKVREIVNRRKFNDIMDVWIFQYDEEVSLCNATTDGVGQILWMNRNQIKDLLE